MKYQYLTGLILAILIGAYTQAKNTAEVTNANPAIKASFRDLVAFSSDGNTFASMNSEGQITLWDVTSGLVRTTLPSQFVNPVKRIVFSPDGNTLAIVGDNSIRLWNFISGNIHLFLPGSTAITDMAFSPDGRTLAAVDQDSRIMLWDSQSGSALQVLAGHQDSVNALSLIPILGSHPNSIDALAFSPDGKILATGGQDAWVKLWDTATGQEQASLPSKTHVTDLAFSPDGRTLAAVDQDSRIMLWDSQSGSALQVLAGHQDSVNALSLIPILGSHPNSIDALAFSPDGKILATGGQDAWIKLWDTATGQEQASLPSKTHVTDLAFSPDGRILAAVNENESVSLWDVSGKSPQYLAAHKDSVIKAAFSSGQKALASVGKTGKVIVWDLMTTLEQLSFDISAPVPEPLTQVSQPASTPPAGPVLKLVSETTGSPITTAAAPQLAAQQPLATATGDPCAGPAANPIVAENCKPGSPASEWDVVGAGDPSIQGFATDISVNRGQTVFFKIDTDATSYRLDIYRMGYYGGDGARKISTIKPSVDLPQIQPYCLNEPTTGLVDCGNWQVSASWSVPADATSGIYFARAVRTDTGGASHIVFIVRDDDSNSDLLYQTSDTTWQAYNDYGGNSLYVGSPAGRAYKVSYNRPFSTRGNEFKRAWLFGDEYPMVRWLEANGYDVSYFTDVDSERRGAEILEHKVFLSVGHDEYWSAGQRANVEAARNAGVHLAFFTGNEMYWKTRWEPSIDGSNTPNRTLVSYKETEANAKIDPLPTVWTGSWRDPRFSPPADGGKPENQLTGTIYTVNCCQDALSITVPEAYSKLRFWRNTSIQTLTPGQVAALPRGVLGYEWDEALDNGFEPAGVTRMSSTTVSLGKEWYLLDHGLVYGPGTATHSLTLYRHSSGALVFGAGTNRWSWGLDGHHDFDPATPSASTTPDVRMQQATVNLFADMGVQPQTLQPGLIAASQSTDIIPPTSKVTSPAAGSTVQSGHSLTITGTASDTGGGVVGGVEVSVDDGATWHPANGHENWSYTWKPSSSGPVKIKSRSVDDSGNLENPGAGINVTVNGSRITSEAIALSGRALSN